MRQRITSLRCQRAIIMTEKTGLVLHGQLPIQMCNRLIETGEADIREFCLSFVTFRVGNGSACIRCRRKCIVKLLAAVW